MTICVAKIANADTGLILETLVPMLWIIFFEKKRAPNPIHPEPKKNNKFSLIWIEEFMKGEKIPTIDAVKLDPSANAAKQPNKINKALMTKSL